MATNNIPILDLSGEIDTLWEPINQAVQRVLRSGQFILGPEVSGLEEEVAEYIGVKHAIGCNSGTDALVLSLRSLDIKPGDEVICPSFSFVASAGAISIIGATPVFADILPDTFNIDPNAIESLITPKTKAIMPVHVFGQAADLDAIQAIADKHNLKIVEDVAQAFGSNYTSTAKNATNKTGSHGDLGAFSFFPTKNFGAYGDAGMLVTNDDALAARARMLRVHGSAKRYHNELDGYNSRLDALQAAILRVKFPHVDSWNLGRAAAADRYDALLANIDGVQTPVRAFGRNHVFHQYTVRIAYGKRDEVAKKMNEAGIGAMIYYPIPIHRLPVYAHITSQPMPVTDQACEQVMSLPMWPTIESEKQQRVVDALHHALAH